MYVWNSKLMVYQIFRVYTAIILHVCIYLFFKCAIDTKCEYIVRYLYLYFPRVWMYYKLSPSSNYIF